MTKRLATELFCNVKILRHTGALNRAIAGLTHDSRTVQPQSLFVALRGRYHDGHGFVSEGYVRGADVVVGEAPLDPPSGKTYVQVPNSRLALAQLASAFYRYPTQKLFTVGITGTKGKTSITHFAGTLLDDVRCLSTIINSQAHSPNTTLESLEIQRLASEALTQGKRNLVLEISAHALRNFRVDGVDTDVAVFTNLTQDHFDDFSGFDDYFAAKARLFSTLKPEATAIINIDDPYGKRLLQQTPANIMSYGLGLSAALHATHLRLNRNRSQFRVHTPQGDFELNTHFPGPFNVYNQLAAVGVGICAGVSLKRIKTCLESMTHLEGRFERFRMPNGVTAIVDFAHSPDSLKQMIEFLNKHYVHVLTVFGCGGESDPYKRPLMGKISGELSDYTILTHDNPKHEDPLHILDQIEAGLKTITDRYEVIPERKAAIRCALTRAKPQDCVLLAGKGHERTQIIGAQQIPYHDGEYLIEAFGAQPFNSK